MVTFGALKCIGGGIYSSEVVFVWQSEQLNGTKAKYSLAHQISKKTHNPCLISTNIAHGRVQATTVQDGSRAQAFTTPDYTCAGRGVACSLAVLAPGNAAVYAAYRFSTLAIGTAAYHIFSEH